LVCPSHTRVLEIADQLTFFGVDTDDRQATTLEALTQVADVEKLFIAIRTGVGGQLLVVDAEGIAHLPQQPRDRVGADLNAVVTERHGHLGGRAARPLEAGDGIARGVVLQQKLDQGHEIGRFFSTGGRPPPARRIRSRATS
jgi:hypothetical protein